MGDSIHKNERSESRGDGERRGSRYQENSYFSFSMMEKLLMVMREVDRYHTIPFTFHNLGVIGRSIGFYSYCRDRSGHRSHTRKLF